MARYYEDYEPRPQSSSVPAWTMVMLMLAAVIVFVVWLYPDILPSRTTLTVTPSGAIDNQAPPSAVRRISAPAPAPVVRVTPIAGLAQNEADADRMYQEAVNAANGQSAPAPAPLPVNSAGEPVIDASQQQQMQQSLTLAEVEGGAAVDQQLTDQRATANADALSRPPDVSYEDAKALLGRDPCSVPRANPATCAKGLYKPTPVN